MSLSKIDLKSDSCESLMEKKLMEEEEEEVEAVVHHSYLKWNPDSDCAGLSNLSFFVLRLCEKQHIYPNLNFFVHENSTMTLSARQCNHLWAITEKRRNVSVGSFA